MPADVRRAKHIRFNVTERADMAFDDDGDTEEIFPSEDNDVNSELLVVNTSADLNNEVSKALQISDSDDLQA